MTEHYLKFYKLVFKQAGKKKTQKEISTFLQNMIQRTT